MVHVEIGCNDIDKTSAFYKAVFDWSLTKHGNSAIIDTKKKGGLSLHINQLATNDLQSYVTICVETDSLSADLKTIEAKAAKYF